ncbi:MAG: ABC transporter substrate-binding protein [Desulfobacterales bacterium]
MRKGLFVLVAALVFSLMIAPGVWSADKEIRIGFNIPLTGDNPDVGASSKNAAEMYMKKTPSIEVGGETYALKFVYEDNEYKAESAVKVNTKLITEEEVLGIVGPQSSSQAVPAGEVANNYETPMISPWSTNPNTTLDRPFVFRGCFLDPFQGPVAANFATDELGAKKAAVIYDIAADYPKGLAEFFKKAFEEIHGEGSVVAFETFTTGDKDFSAQMTNVVASEADVLFVPQYYSEVPLIIRAAKEMGWQKAILGADAWAGGDLMSLCGDDCKGYFFSSHYAAEGATGATKAFIDEYAAEFGKTPDDVAALTWDSLGLMIQAIQDTGGLSGDIKADRVKVKDAMAAVKDYPGITGAMTFNPDGDPQKCAVVVKISDEGKFTFHKSVCPK